MRKSRYEDALRMTSFSATESTQQTQTNQQPKLGIKKKTKSVNCDFEGKERENVKALIVVLVSREVRPDANHDQRKASTSQT
jgi:hypothetical protein